jgi:hypothetical protein
MNITRGRAALVALAALSSLLAVSAATQAATTYRVTGTGDSILGLAYGVPAPGGTVTSSGRWLTLEYGRNAYTVGMAGTASTASAALLAIARSQSGGSIIVQDNALGVSDYGWRALMRRIVDTAPDDRCLIGVLPAYRADIHAVYAAQLRARASIMAEEFRRQPCRRFVYMASIMQQFPGDFADGQHPRTEAAKRAIRAAIGV